MSVHFYIMSTAPSMKKWNRDLKNILDSIPDTIIYKTEDLRNAIGDEIENENVIHNIRYLKTFVEQKTKRIEELDTQMKKEIEDIRLMIDATVSSLVTKNTPLPAPNEVENELFFVDSNDADQKFEEYKKLYVEKEEEMNSRSLELLQVLIQIKQHIK